IHASTTIPKTYTANTFTGAQTFNGGLTIGSLNGPLQANNGVVSATTSVGVLYGGTGLTSAPSLGNILVGNSSGGYTLTATSSLGLPTFGYLFPSNATSTSLAFNGGLTASAITLGTLNGPIHANNGVLAATSSVGVIYGGTGLTSAPSYGNILVGQ